MDRHWAGLLVFVDHPAVPRDNNIAERAHRTPVVGRKNFYGSASLCSGQLAATMYTLLMTVQAAQVQPPHLAADEPAGLLRRRQPHAV